MQARYAPCTEVAREEKDNNARPAIKGTVENWDDYDVVFIGCPVWWWTTPMIIHTFCESYDFKGKTVVPFCTYAATYRDETLAEIVSSTPDADHLTGEGLTSGRITPSTIQTWIDLINEDWNNMSGGSTAISQIRQNMPENDGVQEIYDLNGHKLASPDNAATHNVYIVKDGNRSRKIIR